MDPHLTPKKSAAVMSEKAAPRTGFDKFYEFHEAQYLIAGDLRFYKVLARSDVNRILPRLVLSQIFFSPVFSQRFSLSGSSPAKPRLLVLRPLLELSGPS